METFKFQWDEKEFKIILNFIKETRETHKITQRDIAKKMNISHSTYCLVENGKQIMTVPFLLSFLKEFNLKFQILEADDISKPNFENINQQKKTSDIEKKFQNFENETLNILNKQISFLEKQVDLKDEQIKQLINIIASFK